MRGTVTLPDLFYSSAAVEQFRAFLHKKGGPNHSLYCLRQYFSDPHNGSTPITIPDRIVIGPRSDRNLVFWTLASCEPFWLLSGGGGGIYGEKVSYIRTTATGWFKYGVFCNMVSESYEARSTVIGHGAQQHIYMFFIPVLSLGAHALCSYETVLTNTY